MVQEVLLERSAPRGVPGRGLQAGLLGLTPCGLRLAKSSQSLRQFGLGLEEEGSVVSGQAVQSPLGPHDRALGRGVGDRLGWQAAVHLVPREGLGCPGTLPRAEAGCSMLCLQRQDRGHWSLNNLVPLPLGSLPLPQAPTTYSPRRCSVQNLWNIQC